MAHGLKINGGSLSSAIDLAGTATTGYRLRADPPGYQPIEAVPEVIYGGSPYFDSNRPLFTRRGNVVETIIVDIIGSSVDNAISLLRSLKRILREAQEYSSGIGYRKPVWLEFQPQGSTNAVYSAICNGYVQEPSTMLDTPLNAYMLEGVVITIEREPFFRELAPNASTTITTWATQVSSTTVAYWGETTISSTPGDMPALCRLELTPSASLKYLLVGIRSNLAASSKHAGGGVWQAESETLGTDATLASDATASPGSGNSKVQVSFGTTTDAIRLTVVAGNMVGAHRAYARLKVTSTRVCTVHAKYGGASAGTYIEAGITATVSSTSWAMYDLGVVQFPTQQPPTLREPSWTNNIVDVYAASVSGSGNLDIDFIYFMPVDEYFVYLSGSQSALPGGINAAYRYENCTPFMPGGGAALANYSSENWHSAMACSGDLQLPPGDATLYWLTGDASWGNTQGSNIGTLTLYRVGRYSSARGA